MRTPFVSMFYVFIAAFIGSFGGVFLKAGAHRLDKQHLLSLVLNWRLVVGVSAFLLSSVFFVLGVRQGELSILYPMVSLGYIWTLVWSRLFFKEPLTREKFAGVALILLGVVFLGLGNR
jgi:multidrug transporter EmrE-like cation transporter